MCHYPSAAVPAAYSFDMFRHFNLSANFEPGARGASVSALPDL